MDFSKGLPVGVHEVSRPSANYHRSIWGDYFLDCVSDSTIINPLERKQVQDLREEVRKMLMAVHDTSSEKVELIDKIQRLGVSYHFEEEIEASLQRMYEAYRECNMYGDDLYLVAIGFRLLRQQGHFVSCDVFKKFKDNEGNFDKALTSNVPAMLSLYEAAHMRVHGEDILEEALVFISNHLKSMIPILSDSFRVQVLHALNQPIHMSLTRVEARRFLSTYQSYDTKNELLLEFAKLDFNLLQKVHRKELSSITRWWKDLDIVTKCPFARDRLVESYFWALGVYFEPKFVIARRMLAKVIALATIIDDIYDAYGSYDEHMCFTEALERWDVSAIDGLPPYMKSCYLAILGVYAEMEEELAKRGESYRVDYAKNEMKKLTRAYFEEAKWSHSASYIPTFEEYMKVALDSSGYMMAATTSLVGIGDNLINKNVMDWVTHEPLIVQASTVIARLMDDMAGHEFEQERGHEPSAVECYMKQHGTSKEEVLLELQKLVSNAWKEVNRQCLYPREVPMLILMRVLNLARVIELLYKDGDAFTHSTTKLKNIITSILVDPVP
ncbi:(-)-germacrene D synthase-like [Nicotiana sylvestris]|nr:PREDICTED: (-)-germacrene D synthase-like [Nicotiana sylvestris]